jgi:3,4-dihydroxy 2-butanone 4-phosphate synthase/GTP cyclohydrolase II
MRESEIVSHKMGAALGLSSMAAATQALRSGELVVVVQEASPQHSGHGGIVSTARLMNADKATLMAVRGRGILSILVDRSAAARLGLVHMQGAIMPNDRRPYFLTSIEAAACDGTGISAFDRALTMRIAGDPRSSRADIRTPGHIMPILVSDHYASDSPNEFAYQLLRQGTGHDVAAWCDILNDAGEVASVGECRDFAERYGLLLCPSSRWPTPAFEDGAPG